MAEESDEFKENNICKSKHVLQRLERLERRLLTQGQHKEPHYFASNDGLNDMRSEGSSASSNSEGFWDYLKGFTALSTLHGIPYITTATRTWIKLLWALLMTAALGVAIWQSVGIFTEYLSYPVLTVVEMHHGELTYPQITLCNKNAYWKTKVQKSPQFEDHPYFNSSTTNILHELKLWNSLYILPEKERTALSHNISDFLKNRNAELPEWSLLPDPYKGNCYSLVPEPGHGREDGIDIYINMNPDEKLFPNYETESAVYIREPGLYPLAASVSSFRIRPGQYVEVDMTMEVIERLNGKYGYCQDDEQRFFQETGLVYSQDECKDICIKKRVKDNCGCADKGKLLPDKYKIAKIFHNLTDCWSNDLSKCYLKFSDEKNYDDCECRPRCHTQRYITSLKTSEFSNLQAFQLCTKWRAKCKLDRRYFNRTKQWVKLNTAILRLQFSDLHHKEFKQVASYPLSRFLSDLGGTVGLYLGASVLTLCELPQLIIGSIVFTITHKIVGRSK